MSDDQTNPYTMMGMMGMMQPNKYIDPAYKDKPLPLPGFYGTPTDAQGNPIQSFLDAQSQHDAWNAANPAPPQGTTLNSTPQPAPGPPMMMGQADGANNSGGYGAGISGAYRAAPTPAMMGRQTPQTAAPAAPAPQNPVDMRQAYLTALSNPGKVTTPGANVPQAQPLGSPSVLDSFMAAHPGGGTAAPAGGGYGNKGFFDTLQNLRSA